jgi:hypothetical protein
MGILTFISLVTFLASMFTGAFIYFRDRHALLHKIFLVGSLAIALQALLTFSYGMAHDAGEARFWWRFDVTWPLIPVVFLYFTLVFSGRHELVRKKWLGAVIFGPASAFIVAEVVAITLTGQRSGGLSPLLERF